MKIVALDIGGTSIKSGLWVDDILEDLKSIYNIKNFSITNVEYKNKKYYFNATYEIGGTK